MPFDRIQRRAARIVDDFVLSDRLKPLAVRRNEGSSASSTAYIIPNHFSDYLRQNFIIRRKDRILNFTRSTLTSGVTRRFTLISEPFRLMRLHEKSVPLP
ncbi:unnamed protein product [Pieris macdunnoughi]|uniref:Uncharacterized protein n=1 Tax=Pieris macdunnoughi TaxID=345717 RepID=A0A821W9Q5_9NEOP|nr:unnamed protein product [Pieris macdunnoughi]